jgi:glycerol-3-phosphate O-acyltransferase
MALPHTGLFTPRPREDVIAELVRRARERLHALPLDRRAAVLEDAVWQERTRLERATPGPGELERVERLARALVRGSELDRVDAAADLIAAWADEIHGRFSMPAFRVASRVGPPALAALLTQAPDHLGGWHPKLERRVIVDGPVELLRELAGEATLLMTPTHVSNLDSLVIGLALTMSGLPPFQYGAGLNLFSNPIAGWWLRRLGAYTVDRTKKAQLYKDVLKDYATRQLVTRHHGLFFPGGTRARGGAIETRVKKGLLGTAVAAWQELLEAGAAQPDVYVVPTTLSFQLTLEAATLIDDHLTEIGRQRYIINDDEFAQPRRLAEFARRVLSLDDAIVVRFGHPIDVLGNPVPADRAARAAASTHRRGYVCDRAGHVVRDDQRDHLYTERLADVLVKTWPTLATVMSTHLVAWVAWRMLERSLGTTDPFRIVRAPTGQRHVPRDALLTHLAAAMDAVRAHAAAGRCHHALPDDPARCLDDALDAFRRYHRSRAVEGLGGTLVIQDPRLCLYYRNRAVFLPLELA